MESIWYVSLVNLNFTRMKGMITIKNCLFFCLLAGFTAIIASCASDELVEPAVYTPKQMQLLLSGGGEKLWQQSSGYYLEDSCRTGHRIQFSQASANNLEASFFRDTTACEADTIHSLDFQVSPIITQPFKTTDSLLFVSQEDTTLIFRRVVRLLTSQHLHLDVIGADDQLIHREEYQAVEGE